MNARAARPGKARGALVLSAVEHHVLVHLVADEQDVGGASRSSSWRISSCLQMVALGLCGLLMMMARVRGVMAALILGQSRAEGAGRERHPHRHATGQLDVGHVAVVAGSSTMTSSPAWTMAGWR